MGRGKGRGERGEGGRERRGRVEGKEKGREGKGEREREGTEKGTGKGKRVRREEERGDMHVNNATVRDHNYVTE